MYSDPKFAVTDPGEIRAFIERYPFATLVAAAPGSGFVATHLPLRVQAWGDSMVFRGHLMRDTDHWRALSRDPKVFLSFLGPDAPVLGSWQLTQRYGGTWNYQAVHANGIVRWLGADALVAHLQDLKDHFESSPGHRFDSLPQDYVSGLLPMIECMDIVVSDLRCLFKLSQNRRVEEFDRTMEGLRARGGQSALVAEEMRQRRRQYYPGADGD
jgi:transcriptional regulator